MKLKHITKLDQIQATVWHDIRSYNPYSSISSNVMLQFYHNIQEQVNETK
jgi:hypothetical protein